MSPRARTVLEAMRNADIVGEEKATDMDHILKLVRMPKGQLSEALHELVSRKLVRHIAHHKAARYCATPP
jgi:DNA-binding IclR family transcriptional regulator